MKEQVQQSTTGPRRSDRARRRRAEILSAAHEVFSAKGYRGGSLGDIADRVGITHQGILHYFGSKEALLVELLHDRDLRGRRELEDPIRPEGAAFLQHVLDTVVRNTDRAGIVQAYTVLSAESVTEDHPAQPFFRGRFDGLRTDLAAALRQVCDETAGPAGPVSDAEITMGVAAFVAVMDGLQVQWLLEPTAVDMPAIARMTLNALLRSWNRPPLPDPA